MRGFKIERLCFGETSKTSDELGRFAVVVASALIPVRFVTAELRG
jgi:hypothetical protein